MSTPEKRPRRRFLKFVLVSLVLLGLFGVFGPTLLAPMIRKVVVNQLDANLNADAGLKELAFSFGGDAHVADLTLAEYDGQPILHVQRVDVDADLLGALRGRLSAEVVIDGLEVHLRPTADGRWNVEKLPRKPKQPQAESQEPKEIPDVNASVELKNARVIVHGTGGDTELSDISFRMRMPGKGQPMTFDAGVGLKGPAGPAGRIGVNGSMLLTPQGPGAGEVNIELAGLLLKALDPVLAAISPIQGIAGAIDGKLAMRLGGAGPLDVTGGGKITLSDLLVRATREGAPDLKIAKTELNVDMQPAAGGAGHQSVSVQVGDLIAVRYDGDLTMAGDHQQVKGKVNIDGSIARLAAAAQSFAPLSKDLTFDGRITGDTSFDMAMGGAGPGAGEIKVDIKVNNLSARDKDGRALDLRDLQNVGIVLDGTNDVAGDRFSVPRMAVDLGPIQVSGRVEMRGMKAAQSGGQPQLQDSNFAISADLNRVAALLQSVLDTEPPALGGSLRVNASARQEGERMVMTTEIVPTALRVADIGVAGDPLKGSFNVLMAQGDMSMTGDLSSPRIAITLADGRLVEQRDLRVDLDIKRVAASERMEIRRVGYSSRTAEVDVKGAMTGTDPAVMQGDIQLGLKAQIDRVLADVGPLLGLAGYAGTGGVDVAFNVAMRPERMTLDGGVTIERLDLTVPPQEPGGVPTKLAEPSVSLLMATALDVKQQRMELQRFKVKSETLWGDMTGAFTGIAMAAPAAGAAKPEMYVESMKGDFKYIPDRLNALIAPHIPGQLIGATAEDLNIDFKGPIAELDLIGLLAKSNVKFGLGLGTFSTALLDTTGKIDMEVKDGRMRMLGDLGANGGTLDLQLGLGVSAQSSDASQRNANLSIKLSDVKAGSALGDLLGKVHPIFGSLDAGAGSKGSDVLALLGGELDLRYNGPTSLEGLLSGWRSLPKDLFYGKGLIRIDQPALKGSPLLDTLFRELGVSTSEGLSIQPVAFEIDSSKLTYADAWKWVFGDVTTTFTGGIGFDGGLDLAWNVPVNKRLVQRFSFLESFQGKDVRIPLTGSIGAPKLDFVGAIQSFAGDAAKGALKEQIGDKLGLGDILGTNDPSKETPQALFDRAGKLWDAGAKEEAAAAYQELANSHKLTTVYLLNKDTIEKRAGYKPKDGKKGGGSAQLPSTDPGAIPATDPSTAPVPNPGDPAAPPTPANPGDPAAPPTPTDPGDPAAGPGNPSPPKADKEKSDKKKDDGKSDKEKYKEKNKKDKGGGG